MSTDKAEKVFATQARNSNRSQKLQVQDSTHSARAKDALQRLLDEGICKKLSKF